MPRGRGKGRKPKGPRKVPYEFISPDSVNGGPMYKRLKQLVKSFHDQLEKARIGLAWMIGKKPDVDGIRTLGKARKMSQLDREFMDYDLVITLDREWWQDPLRTEAELNALMDHELCHFEPSIDKLTGDQVQDEKNRYIWRMRKPDVTEFSEIIDRHGIWKSDLQKAASALERSQQRSLSLGEPEAAASK